MPIDVTPTAISGALIIETPVFTDGRGQFLESFNARAFAPLIGPGVSFVQDNRSTSRKNVLRGLHYQLAQTQGKLLQILRGSIFDVFVDLRQASPTFGRWVGLEFAGGDGKQLWLPPGLAHGFLTLSDEAEVLYKVTDYWHPPSEQTLRWDDAHLAIKWPLARGAQPIVSAKDAAGQSWRDTPKFP